MSTGGPNTQQFSPFKAPLRGSFPLDREAKCKCFVTAYLACLRSYSKMTRHDPPSHKEHNTGTIGEFKSGTTACRPEARAYFECRMINDLMKQEEFDKLGFFEDEDKSRALALQTEMMSHK